MEVYTQFLSMGLIALLAAMSPGPDFVLVSRNCLLGSRIFGFYTAVGITCGLLVHIFYALLGFSLLFLKYPTLLLIFKIIGALYLFYLGIQLLVNKKNMSKPEEQATVSRSKKHAFYSGFLCNLLNPKASLFILSLFSQMVNKAPSFFHRGFLAAEVVLITLLWFFLLTFLMTHEKIYKKFQKLQNKIMVTMGILLILFGIRVIF
jgi:RhtB (resistance to homoserine/threonine) family protein